MYIGLENALSAFQNAIRHLCKPLLDTMSAKPKLGSVHATHVYGPRWRLTVYSTREHGPPTRAVITGPCPRCPWTRPVLTRRAKTSIVVQCFLPTRPIDIVDAVSTLPVNTGRLDYRYPRSRASELSPVITGSMYRPLRPSKQLAIHAACCDSS